MEILFREAQLVRHRVSGERMTIIKVLKKRWFRKRQKYTVAYYHKDKNEYHYGRAYESELEQF